MPATTPRTHYPHKVYSKARWSDSWSEETDFFCDRLTYGSGTRIGAAEFRWEFGWVQGYSDEVFLARDPKDLIDKLVKVEVEISSSDKREWFGVVLDDSREYHGELAIGSTKKTCGQQLLRAAELTYFLDRQLVDSSFCQIKSGTTVEEVEVERAIPFNYAGGNARTRRIQANCFPDGAKGPIFSETLDDAFEWTLRDIVDYLVGYHRPKDLTGTEVLPFTAGDDNGILVAFNGTLDPHGESLFGVLNMALDRRRLLSWFVNPIGDDPAELEIKPFALNKDIITLPGGGTIGANDDTVEITLPDDPRLLDFRVLRDAGPAYKKVIARGERVVVVGPIDYDGGNGEFDRDWTDAQETTYEAACSADGGYAALKAYQKRNANAELRAALARPWRFYKFKPEKLDQWLPSSTLVKVNDKEIRAWPPGARFLDVLPLLEDADYTTPSTSIEPTLPAASRAEYMRPTAFILDGTRYYRLDRMSPGTEADDSPETMGRTWSGTVQMRDDTLGFLIDISGAPQHIIGATDFNQADANDLASWPPDLDWKKIILAVAVVTDNWAEAQWPPHPSGIDDVAKELVFYVPGRRMEYVLTGTPFDITTAGALKQSGSGWIADDSQELKDLARIAYEWYQQPRKSLTMTVRTLDCPYHLGQFITQVKKADGSDLEEMNSVITEISLDLLQGSYTIVTQFGELDPRSLVF